MGFKITKDQLKELKLRCPKLGIKLLVAFGSQVKGEARTGSDLDLAFLTDSRKKVNILKFYNDLGEVFERKIDLTNLNRADPLLLKQVLLDEYEMLHGSQSEANQQELRAIRRYLEYKPVLEQEARMVDRSLSGGVGR